MPAGSSDADTGAEGGAAPGATGAVPREGPLILTATLPAPLQGWAEGLRRVHFPPDRNMVPAHVTLFHALPPMVEAEARRVIAGFAAGPPPPARLTGVMDLGKGTALAIESHALLDLRAEIAWHFHGLLTAQDQAPPRLHVTLQNKVARAEALALQADLAATFAPRDFRFAGLALHRYCGGPWQALGAWPFRGTRR